MSPKPDVVLNESTVSEVVYSFVRTIGLIFLFFTSYWYAGILGFILIGAIPKPDPHGKWAWKFFSNDRVNWTIRIITELLVFAAALFGIFLFPYYSATVGWWMTGIAGILSLAAYLYPFTLPLFRKV